jgi:hypothetical protein
VVGPPANCTGTVLEAYDCNPSPRNPAGSICCKGALDSCLIGGVVYPTGALNPLNACLSCQPILDTLGWSVVSGVGCDAGAPDAGGCTIGSFEYPNGSLDPMNGCLSCQPFVSTSNWTDLPSGTSCGDGQLCDSSGDCRPVQGCMIGGVNYPTGSKNPNDPSLCCSPARDPSAWSCRLQDGGAYQVGTFWATGIAVADFNQDGRPDIAVVTSQSWGSTLSIMLGRIEGGFAAQVDYPTCPGAWGLSAGDLDGDGFPDLVVGNCATQGYDGNGGISVHMNRGNGTGTFVPAAVQLFAVQAFGESFPLLDFDGDGILDIALTGGGLYFLKGIGDGGFESPVGDRIGNRESGEFGFSIAAGSFRDAGLDLVTANGDETFLSLFFGHGTGRWVEQPRLFGTGYGRSVAVGDFNGDGHVDLLTVGDSELVVFQGDGDGTFSLPISYPSATSGNSWMTLGDLDGDGLPEAITADFGYGTFSVFWHTADGGVESTSFAISTYTDPDCALVADLNGDGIPDVAIGGSHGSLNLYTNGCP